MIRFLCSFCLQACPIKLNKNVGWSFLRMIRFGQLWIKFCLVNYAHEVFKSLLDIFTDCQNTFWLNCYLNIFTGICHSVHGGVSTRHRPGRYPPQEAHPPGSTPPEAHTPGSTHKTPRKHTPMATAADGTHPTGKLFFWIYYIILPFLASMETRMCAATAAAWGEENEVLLQMKYFAPLPEKNKMVHR